MMKIFIRKRRQTPASFETYRLKPKVQDYFDQIMAKLPSTATQTTSPSITLI